jgi:hypothetical protein
MRLLVGVLAATAVLVSGCGRTTDGRAEWNPAQATKPLRAVDADQVMISPAQLGQIVGAKLQIDVDQPIPIPDTSSPPPCGPLDAAGMQSFVGNDWSGFHLLLLTDGRGHDHVVAEAVALYSDSHSAAKAFTDATKNVAACDGQRVPGGDGASGWKFGVNDVSADTVGWNKVQLGIPMRWVCYGRARVRNNTILEAMSCQADDGGQLNVATILDQISASVWDQSAH